MNLHETAMGQRFFNVQLPALINTLKDIAAALSRPAPSAISFPADQHFLTSLYYGEYEADVFKPDKRLAPFNQAVQQKEKALLPLLSNEASIAFEQYQAAVQCRNSTVCLFCVICPPESFFIPQFYCIRTGIRLWLPYRCADVCGRLRPTAASTGTWGG